jgi:hypothetical protein
MEKNTLILGAGICICIILFFIDIYLGAIGMIILVVLAMSLYIMQDSRNLPDIRVRLREDAQGIVLENRGNETAHNIHVAIVPLNIEFNLAALAPEKTFEYRTESMVSEVKTVVGFEDALGVRTTRSYPLSALGKNDDDLLKPMFPLFSWK